MPSEMDRQPEHNCTSCGRPQYQPGRCAVCTRNTFVGEYKPSMEQRSVVHFVTFAASRLRDDPATVAFIDQLASLAIEYIGGEQEFKRLEEWAKGDIDG